MKFKPETLVHRVILKPFVQKETPGGIILAQSERSQAINSDKGTVLEIGPKAWKDFGCMEPPFKVGDKVYYAKYGAKVLKDEETDELYIIVNDEDLLVGYTDGVANSFEEKEIVVRED